MRVAETVVDRMAGRLAYGLFRLHQDEEATASQRRWTRLALRYYVARWDLIPDFIPGLGMIDDWVLLFAVTKSLGLGKVEVPAEVDFDALELEIRAALAKKT